MMSINTPHPPFQAATPIGLLEVKVVSSVCFFKLTFIVPQSNSCSEHETDHIHQSRSRVAVVTNVFIEPHGSHMVSIKPAPSTRSGLAM